MKDTYKITFLHPPITDNECCDKNLLSSSNKIDILTKNITELRKGAFDKVTTKSLQLNKIQVNEELINEFIKSAYEVTNTVNFRNKVASDTISQLKPEFDNNKFNQNITIIHLDDMFTTGLKNFENLIKRLILLLMKPLQRMKRK